jgi:hypothetical protein
MGLSHAGRRDAGRLRLLVKGSAFDGHDTGRGNGDNTPHPFPYARACLAFHSFHQVHSQQACRINAFKFLDPQPPLVRYMFSATMPPAVERLARKYLRR